MDMKLSTTTMSAKSSYGENLKHVFDGIHFQFPMTVLTKRKNCYMLLSYAMLPVASHERRFRFSPSPLAC